MDRFIRQRGRLGSIHPFNRVGLQTFCQLPIEARFRHAAGARSRRGVPLPAAGHRPLVPHLGLGGGRARRPRIPRRERVNGVAGHHLARAEVAGHRVAGRLARETAPHSTES